ncbi:MAG: RNA methyltransferase [Leptolyngbya sp. SIO3F4]|nr:RNA methyltransferase [Leptolyngbya sp. SIO3F4]
MRKLSMDELNRISVEEFKKTEKFPVVLILDNIRSLNNVGAAFRTADAFRIEKIYLCGITGKPPHRDIRKTALGASESVTWQYYPTTLAAIDECKAAGYHICAVEQAEGSTSLEQLEIVKQEKYAFIFGNEVFGVEDDALAQSDKCIEIPQFGTKHSLNISVSIGIVLWHYMNNILKK